MISILRVISPGFLTTVQALGRPGYAHLGISACGAADALSLRLGNRLAGNPDGAASLEMTLAGGSFGFDHASVIAITGSDFQPTLDDMSIPLWQSVFV